MTALQLTVYAFTHYGNEPFDMFIFLPNVFHLLLAWHYKSLFLFSFACSLRTDKNITTNTKSAKSLHYFAIFNCVKCEESRQLIKNLELEFPSSYYGRPMSFHRGGGPPGHRKPGESSSGTQRTGSGFSMNAVPPPSSLMNRGNPFQRGRNALAGAGAKHAAAAGLSKHGYSTLDSISQFANSSQYALGKRKSKTEDE